MLQVVAENVGALVGEPGRVRGDLAGSGAEPFGDRGEDEGRFAKGSERASAWIGKTRSR